MSAGVYDSIIDQGADWYLNFQYQDSNGFPIDLTGYTARMQLRSLPEDPTPALTLTTGSGITILGFEGLIEVHATAAQTGSISAGYYYYDVELTAPITGVVIRLIQGQFQVNPQVTR